MQCCKIRGVFLHSFLLPLIPDGYIEDVEPKKRLDDLIHLAELCIEVLQQNEEHHAEVRLS